MVHHHLYQKLAQPSKGLDLLALGQVLGTKRSKRYCRLQPRSLMRLYLDPNAKGLGV